MKKNLLDTFAHHLLPLKGCAEYEHLSDQHLLQRYTDQHDERAFDEVVSRHGAMVWAICKRILGQRQDAEDVYQVTFLKLIRQAAFVQQCESVESWLHTVARNAAFDAKSKRNREYACERSSAKTHEEGYVDPRNREKLAVILDEEIKILPERLRNPIIMCYLEGLTHQQAAQRMNISTYSLRRRLTEARKRLQQRLSKESELGEKG